MAEILDRLGSVYQPEKAGTVTPCRIQKVVEGESTWTVEDIFNLIPPEVKLARFTSKHGHEKPNQVKRFKREIKRLLNDPRHEFSPTDLIKLNEESIRKNGSIDEEKFKDFLKGGEEI